MECPGSACWFTSLSIHTNISFTLQKLVGNGQQNQYNDRISITISIMTLRIMSLLVTLSINGTQHNS
jgi:hypothetical protein